MAPTVQWKPVAVILVGRSEGKPLRFAPRPASTTTMPTKGSSATTVNDRDTNSDGRGSDRHCDLYHRGQASLHSHLHTAALTSRNQLFAPRCSTDRQARGAKLE